jgi:hypothetical protein
MVQGHYNRYRKMLKVKVSDNEAADVYTDVKTGQMLSVFKGKPSEYSKK